MISNLTWTPSKVKGIHRLPLGRTVFLKRRSADTSIVSRNHRQSRYCRAQTVDNLTSALGELSAEPSLLIISTGFRDAAQPTHLLDALDNLNSCPCRAILPNRSTRGCDAYCQDAAGIAADHRKRRRLHLAFSGTFSPSSPWYYRGTFSRMYYWHPSSGVRDC